ncbi:MAG: SpoIIE family protein phosphatase [Firmicutes bacterium]|nr:SpoIIE family protein phosphatase [Bacillota bacterium]
MSPYIKLSIAALLPVAASILFYMLEKRTEFGKRSFMFRQIIIGLAFGIIAIVGTEWGIAVDGAMVNCRDAAPLCAGLLFGGPAGMIAGVIGGVERWIAVAWGVGSFTRVACSASTVLAGVYAAIIRRYLFEGKRPGWLLALASGVVIEVFHLTMVFITNTDQAIRAAQVVKICSVPMVTANGLSVLFATVALTLLSGDKLVTTQGKPRISKTIQTWMIVDVAITFIAASLFLFFIQTQVSQGTSTELLSLELDDITSDITDASNDNLLRLTHRVADRVKTGESLYDLAYEYGVADICVIDKDGIITDSNNSAYLGFDMGSGEQSAEFLVLLDGETEEYVQGYGPISFSSTISRKFAGVDYNDGILQVGYNASQFQKDIANRISLAAVNRHVGENGFVLIADAYRKIVSSPRSITAATLDELGIDLSEQPEDSVFSVALDGAQYESMFRKSEGYYILSMMPVEEVFRTRDLLTYLYVFIEILIFSLLFMIIYLLIKTTVVKEIQSVNRSLDKITAGDLDEVVNVRSSEEFDSLSDDINSTVDTLKKYIAEAEARIDAELKFAKSIQHSALPSVFPKRGEIDLYAQMDTAKEVGGDFYDFYFTENSKLNFMIADVSGKGIPAAMFMMRAKTQLKGLSETGIPLNEVFTQGNSSLCEGNDAEMFVTAWEGAIDLQTGHVQFVNAGHNPPLVMHDGRFEYLKKPAGFVLGGMDGIRYKLFELDMAPGDVIYLYTDGITEAENIKEELYGEERLITFLNSNSFAGMEALCDAVKENVDLFAGEAPQFDDMTMLALKYNGPAI